jgi:hypothetical protein
MTISSTEYYEQLEAYIKSKGGNPGTTFFGSWAWYATTRNEFDAMLKADGINVVDRT